jgi:Zn-dependent peptidase ImmA (M78 family)
VRIEPTDLGEDCSGVLVRTGDSAVIGVNVMHHPNRQRFTIAHELGHYMLHKPGTYVDRAFYRNTESGSGTIKEEREANQFAAALLMPASWVEGEAQNHSLDLGDDTSLVALAEEFGVSSQAMSFRLTNLGLVGL